MPGDDTARAMGVLLRKLSGFSGLVHENMYRFTGWRFLSIGRSLERASSMLYILARFADPEAPEGAFDLAIEVGDSAMSHRRRYAVATSRETVIDMLALDPLNPRSVIYQFDAMQEHLSFLPGSDAHRFNSRLQRSMLQTYAQLAGHTVETLDTEALMAIAGEVADLSNQVSQAYFR